MLQIQYGVLTNLHPDSPDPTVVISLSLHTSLPTLALPLNANKPFHITINARIVQTPHPTQPITLATHLTPLSSITNGAFDDILCISQPAPTVQTSPSDSSSRPSEKKIRLNSSSRPHYIWDPDDLAASWDFVTIPAPDSAVPYLSITHEIPVGRVTEADLAVGERYRVSLTERGLGARWWAFGSLDAELNGLKLKQQRRFEMSTVGGEGEQDDGAYGEKPGQLSLVVEGGGAEFDIVPAHPNE